MNKLYSSSELTIFYTISDDIINDLYFKTGLSFYYEVKKYISEIDKSELNGEYTLQTTIRNKEFYFDIIKVG